MLPLPVLLGGFLPFCSVELDPSRTISLLQSQFHPPETNYLLPAFASLHSSQFK